MATWDARDYSLAGLDALAFHEDMASTGDVLRRGGRETDPLLGANPSQGDLNRAELAADALTFALASQFGPHWRRILMGAVAGAEGAAALRNRRKSGRGKPSGFATGVEEALPGLVLGAGLGWLLDALPAGQALGVTPAAGGRGAVVNWLARF
jgi:hypothetical protein